MPQLVQETASISEAAAAAAADSGRMLIQFIDPGWGSSAHYSTQVLEQAAADRVIPAGTHMYADHPTEVEAMERPIRSIKDLMAVTTEDAYVSEGGALVGEVQVVPQWRDLVKTVKDSIGVSIRGEANVTEGEIDGRRGLIAESLVAPVMSVDFVTRAGRGGKVLSVLESARANSRAMRRGVAEATVNDTREALQTLLRDTYSAEKTYVWVRDFDDSTVWFEVESGDDSGCYGQSYTQSDAGAVALSGDRTEVRVSTTYVPVRPGSSTTTTEESQEDTMPHIQIDEAEHTRLVAEAGRVTAVEAERDTAVAERDQLRTENARLTARESAVTHARARVTEANATLPAATVDRIVAAATTTVPLTEAGQLDTTALDTAVDTARTTEETYLAGLAEAAGIGSITGFGGSSANGQTTVSEADIDAAVGGAFGHQVKEA